MNIEIGKTYIIDNANKKSVFETETFAGPNNQYATIETMWRAGTFEITPQNDDEINDLLDALNHKHTLYLNQFEQWELVSTWDGCSEDLYTSNDILREDYEELGWEAFDNHEYYSDECEIEIVNGITITTKH